MLNDELLNKVYSKTFHRKALSPLLNNRSEGSIEFKHQNISGVLVRQGLPYIRGYKPRFNYQQILEERTLEYISNKRKSLVPKFEFFAENAEVTNAVDFAKIISEAPEKIESVNDPQAVYKRRPIKINYIEREQKNVALGLKGEELIIEYERWRLINEGKDSLASRIEWVSKNDDGAGFDILSKNKNGTDRYIEVKTTKLSKETPFYFSKNEYEFSKEKTESYHLYRLYNFSESPKLFLLNGDFDSFCKKEAIQYKGYF
ncbi:MAG: hypothetical protein JWO09_3569 [Bacteroidetes bacterium]|nr:hypothetical protein [Bacteroidota bacterium]